MVTRALGDHERLSRTKLASHTNIRFRILRPTCTVYIKNFISSQNGIRVESHTRRYSLSHHIIIWEIKFCEVATITLFPVHLLQRKLTCSTIKSKSACLLRKSPKQNLFFDLISSHAGNYAAACRRCSARNSRHKLT